MTYENLQEQLSSVLKEKQAILEESFEEQERGNYYNYKLNEIYYSLLERENNIKKQMEEYYENL